MTDNKIEFEHALQQLEEIMNRMTKDELSLNESISYYAKAAELIKSCSEQLSHAKVQVEEIDTQMVAIEDEYGL